MTAPLALLAAAMVPLPPVIAAPAPSAPIPACLPRSSTRDATVVALGMYGGRGAPTPFSIGGSPHALHTVKVTGRGQGKVMLVVAAYEPTVWDLSAIRGRVTAVIASGYYPQGIAGLDKATPVRFSSAAGVAGPSDPGCGHVPYAYGGTADIERMAAAVRETVGSQPRRFFGGYSPTSFDIDGGALLLPTPASADTVQAAAPISPAGLLDPARYATYDDRAATDLRAPTRILEWDTDGTLVRDQGSDPPPVRIRFDGLSAADSYSRPFQRRGWDGPEVGPSGWLIVIAVAAVWWRRRGKVRSTPDPIPAPERSPAIRVVPSPSPPAPASESDRDDTASHHAELSDLAAVTTSEPLVLALHRYGRALQAASRLGLDPDLGDERAAILGRHFGHATARYRQARPTLAGAEADHADETLRRAIERMTARLTEIADEQRHRDMDGIDAAERFIVARHPES